MTEATDFTAFGVANASISTRGTIIDKTGNSIIENEAFGRIFKIDENGLAKVQHPRSRMYGLISHDGRLIVPIIYDQIGEFQDGLAMIKLQGKLGFVNLSGKVVVPPIYDKVSEPSEGLIPVFIAKNGIWNYVNYQGKTVINGKFLSAESFRNGYAIVEINELRKKEKVKVTALIDTEGEYHFVSSPEKILLHYADGFRAIKETRINEFVEPTISETLVYYADDNNYNIFGRSFKEIQPFEGENGFVITEEGWGALNRQGFSVIPNKYIRLIRMEDGNIRGKARFIFGISAVNGTEIQPISYDIVMEIKPNLFRVEKDGKIGYLNDKGEWIWEMRE